LRDHTGRSRRLSEIQGDDLMIIVLAREAYSAKDQVQHEGLVWAVAGDEARGRLGPHGDDHQHGPAGGAELSNSVRAEWPFLADPGRIVKRDLEIAEYTDPAHDQMVPHTIVCEPGLIV
jgi:hypothetical protein